MAVTGGKPFLSTDGDPMRVFEEDGTFINDCDETLTCKVLAIGGGGSGGTSNTRGGGGAGGVTIAEDVIVQPGEEISVTVGAGGTGNDGQGGKSTFWLGTDGRALDPDVDSAPATYSGGGGGYGAVLNGGNGQTPNGSGGGGGRGGGGGSPTTTGGGSGDGDGNDGGGGASTGCVSTCCRRHGGGGGSYAGAGTSGGGIGSATPGSGGGATTLTDFGLKAGEGGQGGSVVDDDPDPGSCSNAIIAGDSGKGYGAGGGGAAEGPGGTVRSGGAGKAGVVAVIYEGVLGTPFYEAERDTPEILSMDVTIDGSGTPTVTWTANDATGGVRVRGETNATGDADAPLTLLDDVDATDESYEMSSLTVSAGEFVLVELEAWADAPFGGEVDTITPSGGVWGGHEFSVASDTLSEDTDGLVFRDQFNAADQNIDGYNGWGESDPGSYQIVSNEVEGVWATAEARQMYINLATGDVDLIGQVNTVSNDTGPNCTLRLGAQALDPHDSSNSYSVNTKSGSGYRISKGGVGTIGSGGTAPANTVENTIRLVIENSGGDKLIRAYAVESMATLQELDNDLTLQASATDTTPHTLADFCGIQNGDGSNGSDDDYDEFFVCGRNITVTGLSSGQKIQVDERTAVEESGGSVTLDVDTWALPATTVKLIGADVVGGTQGPRYRASLKN